MFSHRIALMLLVVYIAFFARSTQAYFDQPWITPASPLAGETVSVNIRGGECDAIFGHTGFPQITQQGNEIRILEYGHHWDFQDFCIYEIGTVTDVIGAFPPGSYTLTVDFTYIDFLPAPTVVTLGIIPFTVLGARTAVAPVPVVGPIGLLALATALCLRAWLWRTRQKGSLNGASMSTHRITLALFALSVAFFTRSAQAFIDPPWISPANPMSGDAVSINIHGGVCDAIFGRDGYPQITQVGNAIRMVWFGEHWPEGSSDLLCSNPIGTLTSPFGTFPPGNYILTVDLAYIDFFGMPSILAIGVVPFTVDGLSAAAATPAPTLSHVTLLVLTVGLGLTALLWRKRQTGPS